MKVAEKRSAEPAPSPTDPVKRVKTERLQEPELHQVLQEQELQLKQKLPLKLQQDLFRHWQGHDFQQGSDALIGIRAGWPQRPEDYPEGYGVANPPGFCQEGCDCMDDQRPQRSWEMHKGWLDDGMRASQAKESIERFAQQTQLVRRRGQVSKMCYFEKVSTQDHTHDLRHARAALDLAGSVGRRISEVMQRIPYASLVGTQSDPIIVPALAFLPETCDIEPLKFHGKLKSGAPLPEWLRLDSGDGSLQVLPSDPITEDVNFNVELYNFAGVIGTASCVITQQRFTPPPWFVATGNIVARVSNAAALDRGVCSVLSERLDSLYDFQQRSPRNVSLGVWLREIIVVLRMLRSTAVAVITPGVSHTAT